MPKVGRPTKYAPELIEGFLRRICEGESVRRICRNEDMPCEWTIYSWLREKPEFEDEYRLATEMRADAMFEDILGIADDPTHDWIERTTKDGETTVVGDHEHIHRSRLRVDARKWVLARMVPRKYGDAQKLDIGGGSNGSVMEFRWKDSRDDYADLPEEAQAQIRAIADRYVRGDKTKENHHV